MEKYDLSLISNKYNEALKSVKQKFDLLGKFSCSNNIIEYINYRVKKPESIVEKLQRLFIAFSLENIEKNLTDIIGVRIICPFLDDLEKVVCIIREMAESGELKIKMEKDYVTNPKDSGYASYHIIVEMPVNINGNLENVNVELQIRTSAMDLFASLEHRIRYKKSNKRDYNVKLKALSEFCKLIDYEFNIFRREIHEMNGNEVDNFVIDSKVDKLVSDESYQNLKSYYVSALEQLDEKLENINLMYEERGLAKLIEHKKHRIKEDDKICRKLTKKGMDISFSNVKDYVLDVAGIRIVCLTRRDLEELKILLSNDTDISIIEEKDYVENPKESGYVGYHLIVGVPVLGSDEFVKVEIQIRTLAMEAWACLEEDIGYRNGNVTFSVKRNLKRLSEVLCEMDADINKIVMESSSELDRNCGGIEGNNVKKLQKVK